MSTRTIVAITANGRIIELSRPLPNHNRPSRLIHSFKEVLVTEAHLARRLEPTVRLLQCGLVGAVGAYLDVWGLARGVAYKDTPDRAKHRRVLWNIVFLQDAARMHSSIWGSRGDADLIAYRSHGTVDLFRPNAGGSIALDNLSKSLKEVATI